MSKPALRLAAVLALLSLAALSAAGQPAEPLAQHVVLPPRGTAMVGGLWCGAGLLKGFSLDIHQHLQDLEGKLIRKTRVRQITGKVEGALVVTDSQREQSMQLVAQGNQLRIIGATGMLALARGQFFERAVGGSCTH